MTKYFEVVHADDEEIAAACEVAVGTWVGRVYTQVENDVQIDIYHAATEEEIRSDITAAMAKGD